MYAAGVTLRLVLHAEPSERAREALRVVTQRIAIADAEEERRHPWTVRPSNIAVVACTVGENCYPPRG